MASPDENDATGHEAEAKGSAGSERGWTASGPHRAHRWRLPGVVARWLGRWRSPRRADEGPTTPVARFQLIALSREAGAGGGAIARQVGRRLGWKVFDHELLEAIARRMEVPIEEARSYDELAPSVIQDWLLPLSEEHYAPHEAYLDHLAKLVDSIGRAGNAVIVGRGAGFLLPRDRTLNVRVVAPLKVRAHKLAERLGVSTRTSRRAARDLDRRAARFARVMHHVDAADPHHYDLVVDAHSLGVEITVEVIVRAVEAGRPGFRPSSVAAAFDTTTAPSESFDALNLNLVPDADLTGPSPSPSSFTTPNADD
jgi:cytidylate kinase